MKKLTYPPMGDGVRYDLAKPKRRAKTRRDQTRKATARRKRKRTRAAVGWD